MIVDGEKAWIALLEPESLNARCWRIGLIFGRSLIAKWHHRIALARTLVARDSEVTSVLYLPPDDWEKSHVVFLERLIHDDQPVEPSNRGIGTRRGTVILDEIPPYARPVSRDAPYWCSLLTLEIDSHGVFVRYSEHQREENPDPEGESVSIDYGTLRLNASELLEVAISPN